MHYSGYITLLLLVVQSLHCYNIKDVESVELDYSDLEFLKSVSGSIDSMLARMILKVKRIFFRENGQMDKETLLKYCMDDVRECEKMFTHDKATFQEYLIYTRKKLREAKLSICDTNFYKVFKNPKDCTVNDICWYLVYPLLSEKALTELDKVSISVVGKVCFIICQSIGIGYNFHDDFLYWTDYLGLSINMGAGVMIGIQAPADNTVYEKGRLCISASAGLPISDFVSLVGKVVECNKKLSSVLGISMSGYFFPIMVEVYEKDVHPLKQYRRPSLPQQSLL